MMRSRFQRFNSYIAELILNFFFLHLLGFDSYYRSLRPAIRGTDGCREAGVNDANPNDEKLQINCRNIWFNEFWSQHHRCTLPINGDSARNSSIKNDVGTAGGIDRDAGSMPACTGNEIITNYEQEGLVPFVGK